MQVENLRQGRNPSQLLLHATRDSSTQYIANMGGLTRSGHHYLAAVLPQNQVSHLLKGIRGEHSSKLLVSE